MNKNIKVNIQWTQFPNLNQVTVLSEYVSFHENKTKLQLHQSSQQELKNTPTASLQRSKTPTQRVS